MKLPDGCFVRLIDLPYSVGAMLCEDEEGNQNIYVNARHCRRKQLKSLRHELRHISRDDMTNARSIVEVES